MEKMYGTYLGFMFSDESAVGTGELKVVIDDSDMTVLIATGLEVDEQVLDMASARSIDKSELVQMFIEEFHQYEMHGLRFADGTVAVVIELPEDTLLTLGGKPGYEMVGPTHALKAGADGTLPKFEQAVVELEQSYDEPGGLPRVATQGRAPRDVV